MRVFFLAFMLLSAISIRYKYHIPYTRQSTYPNGKQPSWRRFKHLKRTKHGTLLSCHQANDQWVVSGFSLSNTKLMEAQKCSRHALWQKGSLNPMELTIKRHWLMQQNLTPYEHSYLLHLTQIGHFTDQMSRMFSFDGDLEEEVYLEIPLDFHTPATTNKVCKLEKSLYDLKQSPCAWFNRFTKVVK